MAQIRIEYGGGGWWFFRSGPETKVIKISKLLPTLAQGSKNLATDLQKFVGCTVSQLYNYIEECVYGFRYFIDSNYAIVTRDVAKDPSKNKTYYQFNYFGATLYDSKQVTDSIFEPLKDCIVEGFKLFPELNTSDPFITVNYINPKDNTLGQLDLPICKVCSIEKPNGNLKENLRKFEGCKMADLSREYSRNLSRDYCIDSNYTLSSQSGALDPNTTYYYFDDLTSFKNDSNYTIQSFTFAESGKPPTDITVTGKGLEGDIKSAIFKRYEYLPIRAGGGLREDYKKFEGRTLNEFNKYMHDLFGRPGRDNIKIGSDYRYYSKSDNTDARNLTCYKLNEDPWWYHAEAIIQDIILPDLSTNPDEAKLTVQYIDPQPAVAPDAGPPEGRGKAVTVTVTLRKYRPKT